VPRWKRGRRRRRKEVRRVRVAMVGGGDIEGGLMSEGDEGQ